MEAEWCGERNGRLLVSAPPSISPATEAIIDTSSNSALIQQAQLADLGRERRESGKGR